MKRLCLNDGYNSVLIGGPFGLSTMIRHTCTPRRTQRNASGCVAAGAEHQIYAGLEMNREELAGLHCPLSGKMTFVSKQIAS